MTRTRQISSVGLWPIASDEMKAHVVSLVIGRYFTTPALLSHWSIDDWVCLVAVILETEIQKLVASYGESLPEIPAAPEQPVVLAQTLIARWKLEPALQERFPSFLDFVEDTEMKIAHGMNIDHREP